MKASDFNKKPEELKIPKLTRTFTGDHLVAIIKSLVGIGIVFLLLSTGKWFVEFLMDHQPVLVTQEQVDSAVVKFVNPDTLTIPVEYKYKDSHFVSNGDTTYWFFTGNLTGPDNYYQGVSRTIKMPYPFFNFYEAADFIKKGDKKAKDTYIENFIQISKASYLSYKKYANAN
jgi:hypothetical protein